MCIYNLVCDTRELQKMPRLCLPQSIYPIMLSEAIYQRQAHAVEWLISTWPMVSQLHGLAYTYTAL